MKYLLKLLSLRLRYSKPDVENYYFLLAINYTKFPEENLNGIFFEILFRRFELVWKNI